MFTKFIGKVCVIRADGAGVFMGEIAQLEKSTVVLKDARRLWFWSGANSLSDLSVNGVANPGRCKFPVIVGDVIVNDVLEVIIATDKAIQSVKGVPVWTCF